MAKRCARSEIRPQDPVTRSFVKRLELILQLIRVENAQMSNDGREPSSPTAKIDRGAQEGRDRNSLILLSSR